MSNDFYTMAVRNHLGNVDYKAQVIIQNDDVEKREAYAEKDENGTYNLPIEQPTDLERHVALGQFMDVWSKVEMAMSRLLSGLLSTDRSNMPVLMNSLGTRGQLDTIIVLARGIFEEKEFENLTSIIDRIRRNSTRRNFIVHGYWLLEIIIVDQGGRPALVYNQFRAYDPSDKEERIKLEQPGRSKERDKYYYSVSRINSISSELQKIWDDLGAFNVKYFLENT